MLLELGLVSAPKIEESGGDETSIDSRNERMSSMFDPTVPGTDFPNVPVELVL